jgi:predicted nucleic acid-binding protein
LSAACVLDAFAVMAFLRDEPGGPRVREWIEAAAQGESQVYVSLINYGEVLYAVERRWGEIELQRVVARLDNLPIQVVPIDRPLTFAAAHVKALHRLSYADAFAVALAQRLGVPIVTGDPEFKVVEKLVHIEWLGQPDSTS